MVRNIEGQAWITSVVTFNAIKAQASGIFNRNSGNFSKAGGYRNYREKRE